MVIKCKTCNGTGKIKRTRYELDSIGKMSQNPPGYIGLSVERVRFLEEHTHPIEYIENCYDCGGSGCKWRD